EGSVFSFTLPIYEEKKEAVKEVASTFVPFMKEVEELSILPGSAIPTSEESMKILVADDEAVNLQVLMNQLSLEGYEVITAKNGEEALEKIEKYPVDLLILDIMMPKMSGYEVCQRLRKNYSLMELPILMLTAKNQIRDIITSLEVGANDYLVKP